MTRTFGIRIVAKHQRTADPKYHLEEPFFTEPVCRELYKANIHARA